VRRFDSSRGRSSLLVALANRVREVAVRRWKTLCHAQGAFLAPRGNDLAVSLEGDRTLVDRRRKTDELAKDRREQLVVFRVERVSIVGAAPDPAEKEDARHL
jgi:hypothetical protein